VNLFKRIDNPVKFKNALINAKADLEHAAEPEPVTEVAPVAHVNQEIPAMIGKLAELRAQGILTEIEFQQKKSELLSKL
ncbi:MAG TPA: SHOCT domain-containing protein, partial [Anaerolineales bacterium]|nr:SHOCT domain-containing protein [Anaerolineales bacterium]